MQFMPSLMADAYGRAGILDPSLPVQLRFTKPSQTMTSRVAQSPGLLQHVPEHDPRGNMTGTTFSTSTPPLGASRSSWSQAPRSPRSMGGSTFRGSQRIHSARSGMDEPAPPLPVLPSLPQLSGWTAKPSASIAPDAAAQTRYPFSSQHLGVLFSMLQDMSESPWAKASAVSYDVVAMERWMNVLLAQRLDGCVAPPPVLCFRSREAHDESKTVRFFLSTRSRIKLERAQRRIDQAIGDELRAFSTADEVRLAPQHLTLDRYS